jgi:hypothetical protein
MCSCMPCQGVYVYVEDKGTAWTASVTLRCARLLLGGQHGAIYLRNRGGWEGLSSDNITQQSGAGVEEQAVERTGEAGAWELVL